MKKETIQDYDIDLLVISLWGNKMSYIDAKESTLQHTSTYAKKITQFFHMINILRYNHCKNINYDSFLPEIQQEQAESQMEITSRIECICIRRNKGIDTKWENINNLCPDLASNVLLC